jgi:hypothetical protein
VLTAKTPSLSRPVPSGTYDVLPADERKAAPPMPRTVAPRRRAEDRRSPALRLVWPAVALVGGLGLITLGLSAQADVLVGQIAAVVVMVATLHGLWRGGLRKLLVMGTFLGMLGVWGAMPYVAAKLPLNGGPLSSGPGRSLLLAGLTAFGVFAAIFSARFIHRRWLAERPLAAGVDRLVGGALGMAEGLMVVLALCWVSAAAAPFARRVFDGSAADPGSARCRVAGAIVQLAGEASSGPLAAVVSATSPIDRIPAFREALEQLNTLGRLHVDAASDSVALQSLSKLLELPPGGAASPAPAPAPSGAESFLNAYHQSIQPETVVYRQLPPSDGGGR